MKYGLGYDWDSVMPGVAAVLVTLKLDGVSEVAQTYLEGYVLAKWEVRLHYFTIVFYCLSGLQLVMCRLLGWQFGQRAVLPAFSRCPCGLGLISA